MHYKNEKYLTWMRQNTFCRNIFLQNFIVQINRKIRHCTTFYPFITIKTPKTMHHFEPKNPLRCSFFFLNNLFTGFEFSVPHVNINLIHILKTLVPTQKYPTSEPWFFFKINFLWPVQVQDMPCFYLLFWYAVLLTITWGIHSELVNKKVHIFHTFARLLNTREKGDTNWKSRESLFKASEVIFLNNKQMLSD